MGVWIETKRDEPINTEHPVTPFVGVWIETFWLVSLQPHNLSHPSWVCGLKLIFVYQCKRKTIVTPFVGVWIETALPHHGEADFYVTPFVGVWIETSERKGDLGKTFVTPFVGVWIETRFGTAQSLI